jgi:copper homeostasis protein
MDEKKYFVEIATSDFITTRSAVDGGADRIELCANLAEGGVTPSYGSIKKCRDSFALALYPIIRPRGGDFLYTEEEFEVMMYDARLCRQLGCDGVVIGLLDKDGSIDVPRTSRLVDSVYPLGVTFHRAFDRCSDPMAAMEQLIEIGCERILTSGQKQNAIDGVALISELNRVAAGRIIIMPGSGVRKENVRWLAEQTGCTEFHSSLRSRIASNMEYVQPAFSGDNDSYINNAIDADEVKAFRRALIGVSGNGGSVNQRLV